MYNQIILCYYESSLCAGVSHSLPSDFSSFPSSVFFSFEGGKYHLVGSWEGEWTILLHYPAIISRHTRYGFWPVLVWNRVKILTINYFDMFCILGKFVHSLFHYLIAGFHVTLSWSKIKNWKLPILLRFLVSSDINPLLKNLTFNKVVARHGSSFL